MYFLLYMEFRLFVFFTCCNVCVGLCLVLLLSCRSGYNWFYSFVSFLCYWNYLLIYHGGSMVKPSFRHTKLPPNSPITESPPSTTATSTNTTNASTTTADKTTTSTIRPNITPNTDATTTTTTPKTITTTPTTNTTSTTKENVLPPRCKEAAVARLEMEKAQTYLNYCTWNLPKLK